MNKKEKRDVLLKALNSSAMLVVINIGSFFRSTEKELKSMA